MSNGFQGKAIASSSLLEQTSFPEGSSIQESKREVTTVVSLAKTSEQLKVYRVSLRRKIEVTCVKCQLNDFLNSMQDLILICLHLKMIFICLTLLVYYYYYYYYYHYYYYFSPKTIQKNPYEPQRQKMCRQNVRPAKTQISLHIRAV